MWLGGVGNSVAASDDAPSTSGDTVMRAMADELDRSRAAELPCQRGYGEASVFETVAAVNKECARQCQFES